MNEINVFSWNAESVGSLIIIGLFGSVLGSFLNVVIYRLPRKESIVFPGSRCPVCGTPVKYRDNVPVLSYILLKGRCRACSSPISWEYPLVEALTAAMAVGLYILNDSILNFIADVSLGSILLAAFAIDLRHMIIPDRLNIAGVLLAFFLSFRWGKYGILRGAAGALTGVAVLAFMIALGYLLFKRQGVGWGDLKLAVVIGFFVGPFWCLITFIAAVLVGGIWGIIQLVAGKVRTGHEVPFGPFIALGGFSVLFFKYQIITVVERYLLLFE